MTARAAGRGARRRAGGRRVRRRWGGRRRDAPRRHRRRAGQRRLERAITTATHIGLVGFDAKGEVEPALASSWRIAADARSVIFRLGLHHWPDGKPVTATDVVASFRRIAGPASRSRGRPLLAALANGAEVARGTRPVTALGIDAPVDNVIEVRAAGAMPGLLALLAEPDLAVVAPGPRPAALGAFRVTDAGSRPIVLTRSTSATTTRSSSLLCRGGCRAG